MVQWCNMKMKALTIRIDKEIHDKIRELGYINRKSINAIIVKIIEEYFKEDRMEACYFCHGTGEHKDFQSGWMETCPVCKGTGGTYTDKKSGYQEPIKDRRESEKKEN